MTDLSQLEADSLFKLNKRRVNENRVHLPNFGGKISVEVIAIEGREQFLMDVNRSYISIKKITYQHRARVTTILARLDVCGPPHRNPDGSEITCPHLHLYREGYSDKWAVPVPSEHFTDLINSWQTLQNFMAFCNIVEPPLFVRELFS